MGNKSKKQTKKKPKHENFSSNILIFIKNKTKITLLRKDSEASKMFAKWNFPYPANIPDFCSRQFLYAHWNGTEMFLR